MYGFEQIRICHSQWQSSWKSSWAQTISWRTGCGIRSRSSTRSRCGLCAAQTRQRSTSLLQITLVPSFAAALIVT